MHLQNWVIIGVNVGKHSIHGASGYSITDAFRLGRPVTTSSPWEAKLVSELVRLENYETWPNVFSIKMASNSKPVACSLSCFAGHRVNSPPDISHRAIEHGHWNSKFTHQTCFFSTIVSWLTFTRGYPLPCLLHIPNLGCLCASATP